MRTLRPPFEVMFAYQADQGSLELHAHTPSRLKPKLERLFCQTILGPKVVTIDEPEIYNLAALEERNFQLDADPGDCVRPVVRRVCFQERETKLRVVIEGNVPEQVSRLVDTVQRGLASRIEVTAATIQFIVQKPAAEPEVFSCDVASRSSSLSHETAEHVALARKCLRRWGVLCA